MSGPCHARKGYIFLYKQSLSVFPVVRGYDILPGMATNVNESQQAELQAEAAAQAVEKRARLQSRLTQWSARLRAAGLDDLAGAFLGAAEPLGPLGAQLLWIAQPTLGLLLPREEIDGLACLLDDPSGMAWLRSELTGGDQ